MEPSQWDVIVVGGGPSGSTAAHLLARDGLRVLLLEQARFPRFHIGESLLPTNEDVFGELGVDLGERGRHVYKTGAEFFELGTNKNAIYPFADSLAPERNHAWQVDRASFDLMLLEAAAEAGAVVHQGERVREIDLGEDRVTARTAKDSYAARYVIDATGQDTFLAQRFGSRKRIDSFGRGAVFGHYGDLKPAIVDELHSHGRIKVVFVEQGWAWSIPLGDGRLSVGLVSRESGLDSAWLDGAIEESPELSRILEGARLTGKPSRAGSFSYLNERPHGARWSCVGDAACFIDPMFSSGVALGMIGASRTAKRLRQALEAGTEAQPDLMNAHVEHMFVGYNVFVGLIETLYRKRLLPDLFFASGQDPMLRKGLTTVLAGDVWHPSNPFVELFTRSKRKHFALQAPVVS